MADLAPTAMLNELMGKFIEESVTRAIGNRLDGLTEEADRRVNAVIDAGTERFEAAMHRVADDIQTRIQGMVEQALTNLTVEGDRLVNATTERIAEVAQKAMDEFPVGIQETLMEMTHENEMMFRKRSLEWIGQLQEETAAGMEAVRAKILEEAAKTAKDICDRNLVDFQSEFENQVHRCFKGAVERLSAPFTLPPTPAVMRQ